MEIKKGKPLNKMAIRQDAEAAAREIVTDIKNMSSADIEKLVHELQIHQIELQIQNDELRRIEQELTESREKYSDLYDFAPVGYVTCDSQGKILEVNLTACSMLGVERKKLLHKHFQRFVAGEDGNKIHNHLRGVFKSGNPQTCEIVLKSVLNETYFNARLESTLRESASGLQCRTAVIDITERKQAEEQASQSRELHEVEKLRGALLDSVSHELRTPLAAIRGIADTLVQPDVQWDSDTAQDFLHTIKRETDILTRIVDDLVQMSQLEAGIESTERQYSLISVVMIHLKEELRYLARNHNLQVNVPDDLPVINIDEVRIGQVITNLVKNAVHNSEKGTMISVETAARDDQLIVTVSDEGIGILPEHIDKVFERFYRFEPGMWRAIEEEQDWACRSARPLSKSTVAAYGFRAKRERVLNSVSVCRLHEIMGYNIALFIKDT